MMTHHFNGDTQTFLKQGKRLTQNPDSFWQSSKTSKRNQFSTLTTKGLLRWLNLKPDSRYHFEI